MPDGCQGSEALRFADKYDGGGSDTVISLKAHLTFQRVFLFFCFSFFLRDAKETS